MSAPRLRRVVVIVIAVFGSSCSAPRLLPDGSPCSESSSCESAHCAEGVCCAEACAAGCRACSRAATGQPDGTCAPVLPGTDPGEACEAQSPESCGTVGTCDGEGACALHPAGTACAPARCEAGVRTLPRVCTGQGSCAPGEQQPCGAAGCVGASCGSDCAVAGCDAGFFCSPPGVACQPAQANGLPCGAPEQCASGFCADGVCCDAACIGGCEACTATKRGTGSDGTCGAITSGADPDDECAAQPSSTCGTAGHCDGAGACSKHDAGTECAPAACTAGTASAADTCDGQGSCVDQGTASCAPYLCTGNACASACASSNECESGSYCSGAVCLAKKAVGQSCTNASECSSGECVDGFCCNVACGGACQACSAAKKGAGADGVCGSIAAGADPDGECAAQPPSSCGTDGTCDGAGGCRKHAAGTECAPASCSAGVASVADRCDGQGTCVDQGTSSCAPYLCSGTACASACSSSGDCAAGSYCVAPTCAGKKANGLSCSSGGECSSGECVDDVCCNVACGGGCQACSAARKGTGADGICGPVAAGTDPDGDCAAEPASTCGTDGTCDGAGACRKHAAGTVCQAQSCASGYVDPPHPCDGDGACVDPADVFCSGLACSGSNCRGACAGGSDCLGGYYCSGGSCLSKKAAGQGCASPDECATGFCSDAVCCDLACAGPCDVCNQVGSAGRCLLIPAGSDPSGLCAPYWCSGTTNACSDSCAANADCKSGYFCSGPTCQPKRGNGSLCTLDSQCTSNFCRDGYCCNAGCNGVCESCKLPSREGTCTAVASLQDPDNECAGTGTCGGFCNGARQCAFPPATLDCGTCRRCSGAGSCAQVAAGSDPDDDCGLCQVCDGVGACTFADAGADPLGECVDQGPCGQDGYCSGAGTCRYYSASTVKVPASCDPVPDIYYPPDTCDGSGGIVDGASAACAPYGCNASGSACRTSCAAHTDCAAGSFCDLGDSDGDGNASECMPKRSNGSTCSNDARDYECAGGECSNGYCCDAIGASCCAASPNCSFLVQPPVCDSASAGGCAGHRVDAVCTNNVCTTSTVTDPAGCAGQQCAAGTCTGAGNLTYTPPSTCASSTCQSGPTESCDDGNKCTTDSCSAATGCGHVNNSHTEACYTGPTATRGIGRCADGVWTCSNGAFGACAGEVLPGAESCSTPGDDDCDGVSNENGATGCTVYYLDLDQDGFGTTSSVCACAKAGDYTATFSGDCRDDLASIYPGRTEVCGNGLDDDCDTQIEEGCTCAHDICVGGAALNSACSSCVQEVCEADAFCCTDNWDSTCVQEVAQFCGSLKCTTGTCAHSPCVAGAALSSTCHSCVTSICAADPTCCSSNWGPTCVGRVASVCGRNCE